MKNYAALDEKIIKSIKSGHSKAAHIETDCHSEIMPVCGDYEPPYRVLDRRLQALRKAKKIEYRGGWALCQPRP